MKTENNMTALEYMEKQVKKHQQNLERESARGACAEILNHIFAKIEYYKQAVEALRKNGNNQ